MFANMAKFDMFEKHDKMGNKGGEMGKDGVGEGEKN
jgi:hypothetical protein